MGVSGSGKTTIGKRLAALLELPFEDADAYHPPANIAKMKNGTPLMDEDRWPWLETLNQRMQQWEQGGVLACSALKESYRQLLSKNLSIHWVYLEGSMETLLQRMEARDHFMKPEMLQSQLDTLEPPSYALNVSISNRPEQMVSEIIAKLGTMQSDLGIVGMGVMGRSLAKNALNKGFKVSVYNRSDPKEAHILPNFLKEVPPERVLGFDEWEGFVNSLSQPRRILLMIPAGTAIDAVLETLTPLLAPGDVVMDGGNSHYRETQRRMQNLASHSIDYLGVGVSGGEEGALKGPSMMAGGSETAYKKVSHLLEAMAAKEPNAKPCAALLGPDGAGHFIKTVHNGIEYGEMQLLAELYALLRGLISYEDIRTLFQQWQEGEAQSFLLGLTAEIFSKKEGGSYVLDKVLDVASSKGTGVWSSIAALESGVPASMMVEAVLARHLSGAQGTREVWAKLRPVPKTVKQIAPETLLKAYQWARLVNHLQGLELIQIQSQKENWNVQLSEVLRVWSVGCIIQSKLVQQLQQQLSQHASLWELEWVLAQLPEGLEALQEALQWGLTQQTALPCFSAAWNHSGGLTTINSPANLIQALRDAFGAHTYQRTDRPLDQQFTTNWKDHGA